jgi:hypothetical protein
VEIYDAIMKAATTIDAQPENFNFHTTDIPRGPGCGTPGCALGWIGHYLGMSRNEVFATVAKLLFNTNIHSDDAFYTRMDALHGGESWRFSAPACAAALRLYAAKYHAPKRTGLPDIVREIFTRQPVAKGEDMIIHV